MPMYQYRCKQCGHELTARQKFSDDPLTECPVCEGELRRVINNVGIVFKGSGFYVTDNRNGSGRSSSPSSKSSSDDKKGSDDKKSSETSSSTSEASAKAPAATSKE